MQGEDTATALESDDDAAMDDVALTIYAVLDLSTRHLSASLLSNLNEREHVIAHRMRYGYLLWVPLTEEECAGRDKAPEPVRDIWRLAQENGCRYVLLDADGPVVDGPGGLPTYWHK
jgi:hypothetical protein